ncbi:MAG: hypothetical protein IKX56_08725 [Muribaculaceae bacterium]|nr:hypothetical protein [Muribaculaceae bacterium]
MKKIVSALLLTVVCCCVISCNEKPKSYSFVKVSNDGKEEVEKIEAKNDTDALKQYFDRLEKIIVANIDKPQEPFKAMYIISPDGDTLNTNAGLLEAVAQTLPSMEQPATSEPAVAVEANPEK